CRGQLLQQGLRLLQIACVEPLSEPPVNRSQQFARLLHLTLITPEAREAHRGAEFPGFGLLLTSDLIPRRFSSQDCWCQEVQLATHQSAKSTRRRREIAS